MQHMKLTGLGLAIEVEESPDSEGGEGDRKDGEDETDTLSKAEQNKEKGGMKDRMTKKRKKKQYGGE